ncbi:hypothetical protein [Nonomuraea sp. NPDC049646]|uniref:hypothetical protein n=1 Tax=unclassified Nonomuraea TaxID=2593643 RepID=UPI0037B2926A
MDRDGLFRLDNTTDIKDWLTRAAKTTGVPEDLRHEGINLALDELERRGDLR